jgi:hypothetical protein
MLLGSRFKYESKLRNKNQTECYENARHSCVNANYAEVEIG